MAYALEQSKLNFLRLNNPDLQAVFLKGMAMFYIQDLAAQGVAVLAAKAGNSATMSWTTGIDHPIHPRSVQIVFAASYDGGDITITGYDQFGRAQTEVIVGNAHQGTTVQGTKVWDRIISIAKDAVGATANTFTVQTGTDHIGLPVQLLGAWGLEACLGVVELGTFNATAHSFKPYTGPDGSNDYTVVVPVDWRTYQESDITEMENASPSSSPSSSISSSPSSSRSPSISSSPSSSRSPSVSPSPS